MRVYKSILVVLTVLFASSWLACTDEHIINVTETPVVQGISGRLLPPEPGTTVAAWQAIEKVLVTADDSGYFLIESLPPGLYELRISAPSGAHRTIRDVDVKSGETTALGPISLIQLPEPFLAVSPPNQATRVAPASVVEINAQIPLSLSSLASEVNFSPALTGNWVDASGYRKGSTYTYRYELPEGFASATSYSVTIPASVQDAFGVPVGQAYSFSFETDSLRRTLLTWSFYSGPSVPWNFVGELVRMRFNALLDESTIGQAISIDPPISFRTEYDDRQSELLIVTEDTLSTATQYQIITSSALHDRHGSTLARPDTVGFSTEAIRIQQITYRYPLSSIPPRVLNHLMSIRYTVPVDPPSAIAAVSIAPFADLDIQIDYYYYGDGQMTIAAPSGLTPGTTYQLDIASSLSSYDGRPIGKAEQFTLVVQPLQIQDVGFYSFPYNYLDTIIAPGPMPSLLLRFNADVDVDSLNTATAIVPAIPGFWYESESNPSSGQELTFFPTTNTALDPERTFLVTIDGAAGLVDGVGLGIDAEFRFYTEPVQVSNLTPAPGNQYVYTHTRPSVAFNTTMEHTSTEAAFTFQKFDGTPVTGTFSWNPANTGFSYYPTANLTPGESYQIIVATTAQSTSGAYLKEEAQTFFRVRQ